MVCQCVDGAQPLTMSAQTRNWKKLDGVFNIGDEASESSSIRPPHSTEPPNGDTGDTARNGAPLPTLPVKSALNSPQTHEPSQNPPMPRPNELSNPGFDTQATPGDALGDRVGQTETLLAGRKNVQFAADTQDVETTDGLPVQSSPLSEPNTDPHSRSQSLYSKLKALKTSTSTFSHSRSPSGFTINNTPAYAESEGPAIPPNTESNEPYFPQPVEINGTQADADAEESAPDRETENILLRKRRRKSGRVNRGGIETAPASPQATKHTVPGTDSMVMTEGPQPGVLARRAKAA